MKCSKCGAEMHWDGLVRTTNPPRYGYKCLLCGHVDYSDSLDIDDNYMANTHIANDSGDVNLMLSPKDLWISETACKLIAQIPYEYVSSGVGGQTMEARHIYAARIAKEMADVIFG